MTEQGLAPGESEQLVYVLETRFAPHLEAATAAVREAERALGEASQRLASAEHSAASAAYTSDPLPFMREGVAEEVEGLERKTTEKKVRTSYRFLVDRSVELAAAELRRFEEDEAAAEQERREGVEACRAAVARAEESLAAARQMQERVQDAERSARQGLEVLLDKLR